MLSFRLCPLATWCTLIGNNTEVKVNCPYQFLLTCESLGSSPVKMSQGFHNPSITSICVNFLYFHRKVNTFKTPEMCLYLDPDVSAGCFTIILRDLFIILSRFLAGSCSLKMLQSFHNPLDQFPSRVAKVNTFKTPEMRLYFDSDV